MKFGHAGASGEPATVSWTAHAGAGHPGPRGARRRPLLQVLSQANGGSWSFEPQGNGSSLAVQSRGTTITKIAVTSWNFTQTATFHMRGAFNSKYSTPGNGSQVGEGNQQFAASHRAGHPSQYGGKEREDSIRSQRNAAPE